MKNRRISVMAAVLTLGLLMSCATENRPAPTSFMTVTETQTEVPDSVEPGTIEDKTNPKMAQVITARDAIEPIGDDEVVVFYYREDGNYEEWGMWAWGYPDGDGAANWDYTQNFEVAEGVAYLRLKKDGSNIGGAPVGADGIIGLIPRQDADWIKDGDNDRLFDTNISNEIVIFSGDQETYPLGAYTPSIQTATFVAPDQIKVQLSGHHGLTTEPSGNGFMLTRADGGFVPAIADVRNFDSADREKNNADTLLILLEEPAEVGPALEISHAAYLAPEEISFASLIVETADTLVPADDYELGALYAYGSVEFRLWTPFAEKVEVYLYGESNAAAPDYTMSLTKDSATGVWSGIFNEVDPDGYFYDYQVTTSRGTRPVLDPYAKSMDAFLGSGPGRAAIIDLAKAEPIGGWEGYIDYDLAQREDAVIYEVSVRDFTISPDAGINGAPGTYLAFIEKLPYLQDLGITHIQLMPVLNFYYTDESDRSYEDAGTASDNNYNWGYDPHSYFTPEGWFAMDAADPYSRVVELKTLIKEIHKAGMGVLLDVVYNHVGNPTVFEDIFPGYYFRLNNDGSMKANSGCGNDLATTHAMVSRLISDSMEYWVDEYKIDGFRFDLMGLVDSETMLDGYAACAAVDQKADVLFEGEGWKMYNGPGTTVGLDQNFMNRTDSIAVFNDEVRDLLKAGGYSEEGRGFITGQRSNIARLYNNLIGNPQSNYTADDPGDSLVYTTCHDGFTLHDAISHNAALNDSDPEEAAEIIARTKLGSFMVLSSQGIAFLHGGQERGRTKPRLNATSETIGSFVRNSYDSSDNINQIVWSLDEGNQGLLEYTRGLIAIRNEYDAFRIGDAAAILQAASLYENDNRLALAWKIEYAGDTLLMAVNADASETFSIDTGLDADAAQVLVDDDEASVDGVSAVSGLMLSGTTLEVEPLTAVMIRY